MAARECASRLLAVMRLYCCRCAKSSVELRETAFGSFLRLSAPEAPAPAPAACCEAAAAAAAWPELAAGVPAEVLVSRRRSLSVLRGKRPEGSAEREEEKGGGLCGRPKPGALMGHDGAVNKQRHMVTCNMAAMG